MNWTRGLGNKNEGDKAQTICNFISKTLVVTSCKNMGTIHAVVSCWQSDNNIDKTVVYSYAN